MTTFKPLSDYGLIGNAETCVLVGRDGSIDWGCFPHVESPSLFAGILDESNGGHFAIHPATAFDAEQRYIERTNVLRTTFEAESGSVVMTDFMPVIEREEAKKARTRSIYRKVTCTRGTVAMDIEFSPRFDYARTETTVEAIGDGVVATDGDERAFLSSSIEFRTTGHDARGSCSLEAGETVWFGLGYGGRAPVDPATCERSLDETIDYWTDWTHKCDVTECVFSGPWHDAAVRSGLVLKLLTHAETGAICAAPTTSLPEEIGGERNWDYRYNWIRDAAFSVQALANLGHTEEAMEYFGWFLDLCRAVEPAEIQPLYGLHGETELEERELEHLSGYRDSAPVRIGNGAATQRQLDIYGELVLAVYETTRYEETITGDDWEAISEIVEYVREIWTEPDEGIWEVRSDPEHFVYSNVMCWVALDRGIEMAKQWDFSAPVDRWRDTRDEIKRVVIQNGFNEELNSFGRSFEDTEALDATALLLPIVGFLPFDDPRVQGTVDATLERLATDDGLVHRYTRGDGVEGDEGAFVMCSFWLVDVLALSGRIEEAKRVFTNVLEYTSPQGLLAEEIDPKTGTQLGNFPQAFSHIGLINSALYLGEVENGASERRAPKPMGLRLGTGHVLDRNESLWSVVFGRFRGIVS